MAVGGPCIENGSHGGLRWPLDKKRNTQDRDYPLKVMTPLLLLPPLLSPPPVTKLNRGLINHNTKPFIGINDKA
jgi:hypothetical protein